MFSNSVGLTSAFSVARWLKSKMGVEEQTPSNGISNPTEAAATAETEVVPAQPPPEEPPKLEEIVTEDVLREIINGYKSESRLVSWQAQPGSKIGDNYMSIMYALQLELEDKNGTGETLDVMLKTIPRNVFRQDMINDMKAFQKESLIYKDVLPIFVQVQQEHEIRDEDLFRAWPKCYAAHVDGQTDYLAMENLKVAG